MFNELKKFPTGERDLNECFKVFPILHRLLNNKDVLRRVTREVLEDFSNENCVYLELRTTPRNIVDVNTNEVVCTKKEYLDTVIEVVQEFESKNEMIVRLLVSVDRTRGLKDALDTVEMCNLYKNDYVVGIDFSGNPKVGSFKEFQTVFEKIRQYNLKLTIHTAEMWEDQDVDFVIKEVRPDRIGHAVCLTKEQIEYLLENPIPIEICPTSNLTTKIVDSIDKHPFYEFYKEKKIIPWLYALMIGDYLVQHLQMSIN